MFIKCQAILDDTAIFVSFLHAMQHLNIVAFYFVTLSITTRVDGYSEKILFRKNDYY